MRRTARDRTEARPKPVQRIELSGKHLGWRLLAVLLLLVFGAASLSYAFVNLMSPGEPGWTEIKAETSGLSYADEFVFFYEIGVSGSSASSEQKALSRLYASLAEKAWQLFSNAEGSEGIRVLNDHPGEIVQVDAALYEAFQAVEASGDRGLYLGPVAEIYDNLFYCQDDVLTVDFDPLLNDDLRAFFARVAAFASDPQAINVELLGNDQVCLRVSEDYLAFAAQEEIRDLIDFHWMRNAFVIDYLADALIEKGYSRGTLSSLDGFARTLDSRESGSYAYGLYDRGEQIGIMRYSGAMSIVALRSYPVSSLDGSRYYVRQDGQIRTAYLDPADGLSRVAVDDLTAYADGMGCAELLLRIAPICIAEELDKAALSELARDGVQSVICESGVILGTDPALVISDLAEGYGME